jgi:catechol 2,3-dioxygenase-like lactoylglutathione lyase family enzyme
MFSFERLRILHAVATYGSVNAAASALHATNSAWGTRSFYFRDPDGNLIDFYAPVKTP